MQALCSIDGCARPAKKAGLCGPHYYRGRRHGDPLAGGTFFGEPNAFFRDVVMKHDTDECLRWPFADDGHGYGLLTVEGKQDRVTRFVCAEMHGPAPSPDHEAAHSCGNGHLGCCSPRHLRWATHVENMADMVGQGAQAKGEKLSTISETTARAILDLKGTATQRAIAARFGVDQSLVSRIHTGKTWGHIHG